MSNLSLLALKKAPEAAKLLVRRNDLPALKTAIQITLTANEEFTSRTYATKYLQDCQLKYKWATALEISQLHDTIKVWNTVIES